MSLENSATAALHYVLPNGQDAVNVLGFARVGGFLTPGPLADLGAELLDIWTNATFRNPVSNAIRFNKIVLRSLNAAPPAPLEVTVPGTVMGVTSSPNLPSNATLAIKLLTEFGGRSFRGRAFHVGLCESQVTADQVGAALSDILGAWDSFRTGSYPDTTSIWSVISRKLSTPTPISSVTSDGIVDSQRRRLFGRGS